MIIYLKKKLHKRYLIAVNTHNRTKTPSNEKEEKIDNTHVHNAVRSTHSSGTQDQVYDPMDSVLYAGAIIHIVSVAIHVYRDNPRIPTNSTTSTGMSYYP
jgi:hypothetical protein